MDGKDLDFFQIKKRKFDLSTWFAAPALCYLEKQFGRDKLTEFVAQTGLGFEYLTNQKNWISMDYFNLFLEKMVRFTANSKAAFEAGRCLVSSGHRGTLGTLLMGMKIFGRPDLMYQRFVELSGSFTNMGTFSLRKRKIGSVCISFKPVEEGKHSPYHCDYIKGLLASIPQCWNLGLARIHESQCAAKGQEECVYEISWPLLTKKNTFFYAISGILGLAGLGMFFFQTQPWISLKDLLLLFFGVGLFHSLLEFLKNCKNMKDHEQLQKEGTRELEQAVIHNKKEYTKLQEANQQILEKANMLSILNFMGEQLNKVRDEEELLKMLIQIITDCIGFERGYFRVYNSDFELVHKQVTYSKDKLRHDAARDTPTLNNDQEFLKTVFNNPKPQILLQSLGKASIESLITPVVVNNTNFYLIAFDNFVSGNPIQEKSLQFFSTVANQVEIALDNISSAKSALNVLSSIPSSIIVFDKKSLLVSYANSSYSRYFNQDVKDILGQNVLQILHVSEVNITSFLEQIRTLDDDAIRYDLEMDMNDRIIGYTLFRMPRADQGRNEIGMIMKDITNQKEVQEQLIRGEKMAALGTLASGIAHEINNPLYGILGTAEVIQEDAGDPEMASLATEIIDLTMQVSDIVKDLSSYSRSLREETAKELDVVDVLEETLRIIGYSPKFIDIDIQRDYGDVPRIYALGGEIRQIFLNVINNAVQAMEGRGKLFVSCKQVERFVEITIRDTGPGIPEVIISKIFDPFFTTKPTGEGMGIGLNIVYRLVTKYKGFIKAKSKLGEGSEFDIRFPALMVAES
ncbi:MAG: GHKL domain-containing protein [Spirochaetales bacterium]|nr:GHKL domain-containing protein [Spirochaetales bacterium]